MPEALGFVSSSLNYYLKVVVTHINTPQLSKTLVNQSVLLFCSSLGQVKVKEEHLTSYHQEQKMFSVLSI